MDYRKNQGGKLYKKLEKKIAKFGYYAEFCSPRNVGEQAKIM
jgi:hypothetical protein